MQNLTIRPAIKDDIRPLAKLHVAAWKVAYAPILMQTHFDWVSVEREVRRKRKYLKDDTPFLVAERDSELFGFILYDPSDKADSENGIDILSFWVCHKHTRKGIGGELLNEVIKRELPNDVFVWVLTGVQAGPSFYEKHDFRAQEETRQDFNFLGEPMPMVRYHKKCIRRRLRKKK